MFDPLRHKKDVHMSISRSMIKIEFEINIFFNAFMKSSFKKKKKREFKLQNVPTVKILFYPKSLVKNDIIFINKLKRRTYTLYTLKDSK